jgi:tRNA pseudouridine38-40 synthase
MRLRLEIAYHGAGHSGWQSQAGGGSVQDAVERAFQALLPEGARVHGAGRTDAGVHAAAQTAHADVPDNRLSPREWLRALNAHLPPSIRIMSATQAPTEFHARFSAVSKVYTYRIWNAPALHPMERDRAWHVPTHIDPEALRSAATLFTGTHDFASFSAKREPPPHSTIRTIHSIDMETDGPSISLTFTGDGFLYKMVRILTAACIRLAQRKAPLATLQSLLENGTPRFTHTAPAHGLCLVRVDYPAA